MKNIDAAEYLLGDCIVPQSKDFWSRARPGQICTKKNIIILLFSYYFPVVFFFIVFSLFCYHFTIILLFFYC